MSITRVVYVALLSKQIFSETDKYIYVVQAKTFQHLTSINFLYPGYFILLHVICYSPSLPVLYITKDPDLSGDPGQVCYVFQDQNPGEVKQLLVSVLSTCGWSSLNTGLLKLSARLNQAVKHDCSLWL